MLLEEAKKVADLVSALDQAEKFANHAQAELDKVSGEIKEAEMGCFKTDPETGEATPEEGFIPDFWTVARLKAQKAAMTAHKEALDTAVVDLTEMIDNYGKESH